MSRARAPTLRGVAGAFSLLAAAFAANLAAAAEPERSDQVALRVGGCSTSFAASLRRILAIELGDLLDEPERVTASRRDSIQVACVGERLQISARSAAGDQTVHNDLPFEAFPGDAAPRAAALAALEALRAVDPTLSVRLKARRDGVEPDGGEPDREAGKLPVETTAARPPRPPPPSPRPPAQRATGQPLDEPARAEEPRRPATRALAGGVARFFLADPSSAALGVRLELSRRFGTPWDAGFDLEGALARRRVGLGTVDARLLSSAVWFGARAGGATWSATAALGTRFGLVELSGSAHALARAHRVTRLFGGPLLLVRGDGALGPLALALVFEGGLAAVGAEGLADGTPALNVGGAWLAASANAGLRF